MLNFIKQLFKDYFDMKHSLAEQGIYEFVIPCYPYLFYYIDPERCEQYYDKLRTIRESNQRTKK